MLTKVFKYALPPLLLAAACVFGLAPRREARAAPQGRLVKTEYDRLKDLTTVRLHPPVVLRERYDDAFEVTYLVAGFSYRGRTQPAPPETVELAVVWSTSSGWEFEKAADRLLSAEVDGAALALGTMDRIIFRTFSASPNGTLQSSSDPPRLAPAAPPEFEMQYYTETLALHVPAAVFLKLAHGKKVSLRVGKYRLGLGREDLQALRELAGRTNP